MVFSGLFLFGAVCLFLVCLWSLFGSCLLFVLGDCIAFGLPGLRIGPCSLLIPPRGNMQDIAQFVQLAQTLCYDLARAEKATDGKKRTYDLRSAYKQFAASFRPQNFTDRGQRAR